MLRSRRKKYKFLICMFIIFIAAIFIFYKIDHDIKPVLFSVSSSEVRIMATEAINRVVKEELSQNVKYSSFVNIKTDMNGEISAIEMNTVEMNKFGSTVALKVQEEMKFIGGRGVSIPFGAITRSYLLSCVGPQIKCKVYPLGNVVTDFKSELESAGINQSRYRVYIIVDTNLQINIPFGQDKMNVVSTIPVVETLIVGKVPNTYLNGGAGTGNYTITVPDPTQ